MSAIEKPFLFNNDYLFRHSAYPPDSVRNHLIVSMRKTDFPIFQLHRAYHCCVSKSVSHDFTKVQLPMFWFRLAIDNREQPSEAVEIHATEHISLRRRHYRSLSSNQKRHNTFPRWRLPRQLSYRCNTAERIGC